MYDINIKNVKKGKKFYFIFFAAGWFFLILMGSFLVTSYIELNSLDSKVTSTKVEVNSHLNDEGSRMYSPIYHYNVNGIEYSCVSNSSSSINPSTKNRTVYYDSANPEKCLTEYSKTSNNIFLVFMLLPILFIVIGAINIQKINKRIKAIKELNRKGKLVKNLQYRLENTGMEVNGVKIQRPVVDYTLSSGSSITLYGDPRHDRKMADADEMVDLVIDETNPHNYFIDFEINRISGNLEKDYFKSYNQEQYLSQQLIQNDQENNNLKI